MNPEIKVQWLRALRSGEYRQGQEILCRIDDQGVKQYCCLGVLTDLAVKAGIGQWAKVGEVGVAWRLQNSGAQFYMGREVVAWSGVSADGELPDELGGWYSLSEMNDKGATFADIADVIEKHL